MERENEEKKRGSFYSTIKNGLVLKPPDLCAVTTLDSNELKIRGIIKLINFMHIIRQMIAGI